MIIPFHCHIFTLTPHSTVTKAAFEFDYLVTEMKKCVNREILLVEIFPKIVEIIAKRKVIFIRKSPKIQDNTIDLRITIK